MAVRNSSSARARAADALAPAGRVWNRLPPWGRKALPGLAALAIVALYPIYYGPLPNSIPVINQPPQVSTGVIMLIFTMMALGLNVVVGYAGLLDLGYVAFYAAGAYMVGWLASGLFNQVTTHVGSVGLAPTFPGIHFNVWMVLVFAGVFTALVGIVIGLPTLRLRGDYLAIVTLGFGEIIPQFVRNGDSFHGFNLTNGTYGITPIDPPGFGTTLHDAIGLPVTFQQSAWRDRLFFWSALALVLVTVFCCVRLRDSRLGRAWIAIREDETAAAAMGVPLMRTKTWAYAIGAFFGGVAGAYYASFKSGAFPQDFYFNISVFILCMVILGGMGSISGVILGAMFLAWLNQEGLANIGTWVGRQVGHPELDVPKYSFLIYGVIIVVMMLFRPQGLIPERRHERELEEGVHDQPLYEERYADEPGVGERA
jgi:branched-chain amino acid transport system permease protein